MSGSLLLLVPSPLEARLFLGQTPSENAVTTIEEGDHALEVALCGIGLAEAGVRSSWWIQQRRPRHVILVGTAGTYRSQEHPIESVIVPHRILVDGIGSGEGDEFEPLPATVTIGSPIETLTPPAQTPPDLALLSVATAAANPADVCRRRGRHPEAVAEDMETFSVALAARMHSVSLTVVRGISNRAGDRQHRSWRMQPALAACRNWLRDQLANGVFA